MFSSCEDVSQHANIFDSHPLKNGCNVKLTLAHICMLKARFVGEIKCAFVFGFVWISSCNLEMTRNVFCPDKSDPNAGARDARAKVTPKH